MFGCRSCLQLWVGMAAAAAADVAADALAVDKKTADCLGHSGCGPGYNLAAQEQCTVRSCWQVDLRQWAAEWGTLGRRPGHWSCCCEAHPCWQPLQCLQCADLAYN